MSEAKIIAVVAQKGGAGKTTVSMTLAGALAARGVRVAVVDMDPQQTSVRWCASAPDDLPFPATVMAWHHFEVTVGREVQKILQNYDFVIVDCPPSVGSHVPKAVLAFADIALIPTRPSGPDVWATSAMVDLIQDVRLLRGEQVPAVVVPTQVAPRTALAKEALKKMRQSALPATRAELVSRTAYQQAAVLGLPLHSIETGAGEAVREVNALADEILDLLDVQLPSQAPTQARTA